MCVHFAAAEAHGVEVAAAGMAAADDREERAAEQAVGWQMPSGHSERQHTRYAALGHRWYVPFGARQPSAVRARLFWGG